MGNACLNFRKGFDMVSCGILASKLGHGSLDGWPPRAVQAGWWGSEGRDKVSYSAQRPVERGVAPGTGDGGKEGHG